MTIDIVLDTEVQTLNFRAMQAQARGQWYEAEALYRQALQQMPQPAVEVEHHLIIIASLIGLGNVFQAQGKLDLASQYYQEALTINPNIAEVYNNLGNIAKAQSKLDAAIDYYQKALACNPNLTEAHYNIGNLCKEQNQLDEAIASYQRALDTNPDFAKAQFGLCMSQLPIIYGSVEELSLRREQYQQHLERLAQYYQNASFEKRKAAAEAVGSSQPFFLAYQGLNDRDLQQVYGQMLVGLMSSRYPQWSQPSIVPPLMAKEKIRVGFVCGFFRQHSVWKIPVKGWIENLDRNHFDLFGYHTNPIHDRETAIAARSFGKFIQGPLSIEKWCETIAQDRLHILIFPELGMDTVAIGLASLRLAPVQMTSWGHPDTSGLPTIDYYLSSSLMETEKAQDYYTEKLVSLPNLSIYYTPLAVQTGQKSKADLGLVDEDIFFWCCQSIYKYLPQHDDIFPKIAKELDNCKFVFIEYPRGSYVTEQFKQRLEGVFAKFELNYQDYCRFVPHTLEQNAFAATTALADVFLDSIGWSGCNSTLEAIAHNLPILTWPGQFMRERHSYAILKQMGIEETIASSKEDYIEKAIRLGQDAQYRQQLSEQIAENKHKLYGDLKPILALEKLFFKVVGNNLSAEDFKQRSSLYPLAEILQMAVQSHRSNNLPEAERAYRQVLESHTHQPDALFGLGLIARQQGKYQQAESYLQSLLNIQPNSLKAWLSLGNLRQVQGNLAQAIACYQKALELQPNSVAVYNNLGYVLQQQGQLDAAIACYQKALELQSNCIEAEVNLATCLHRQGKLPAEQTEKYAHLNLQLGLTQQQQGNLDAAREGYQQAIELQPNLEAAQKQLGVILEKQGKPEQAIICYQNLLQSNPRNVELYFQLGRLYQQQNELSAAALAYQQGLKLINPHYTQVLQTSPKFDTQPSPLLPQEEVVVGNCTFPAIPPVTYPEKKRPFWSVVIPVYDRTQYILECLASVLSQWTGDDEMEILVIDDASTSPLEDLVNALGKGIVRYYRNPYNLGLPESWNAGIAMTRGKWIHLLHDDDYVLPGFYSQLQQQLAQSPESIGAACTGYENVNAKGEAILTKQLYEERGIAQNFLQLIGIANPLNMPAVVIQRTVYEKLGGYHPQLTYTSDWELYKRITAFYDWWYEPKVLACYRQHPQTMTTELFSVGKQISSIRHAIEISEGYHANSEITAISRSYHFNICLEQAIQFLRLNNVSAALNLLLEAIKIDRSSGALEKLFIWLSNPEAASIREEITSQLILNKQS